MSEKENVKAELLQLDEDIQRARDKKDPMLAELLKTRGRRMSQLRYCEFRDDQLASFQNGRSK